MLNLKRFYRLSSNFFISAVVFLAFSTQAMAVFSFTSTNPADGPSTWGGTCYANGGMTQTNCIPTGFPAGVTGSFIFQGRLGAATQTAIGLGGDGNKYLTYGNSAFNGVGVGSTNTIKVFNSATAPANIYFGGLTVYQTSGTTKTVTITTYSDSFVTVNSTTSLAIPSGVATVVSVPSIAFKSIGIAFPAATAMGVNKFIFSTTAGPAVTSISPTSGPLAGGTAISITGTNFTGATAVTVGGVAATGITVVNATTITATTPAGTAGAKNVAVTTSGGTGTGTGIFTYGVSKTDPTQDPTVRGQVAAQITSVTNFARTQTRNMSSHLSRLHSNSTNVSGYNNISLNMPGEVQQFMGLADALVSGWAASKPYLVASNSSDLPAMPPQKIKEQTEHGIFGMWFEGSLDYGTINANTSNNKFTSSGLTTGMDYLLQDNFIVGAALGFGWDETTVDAQGTKTTSISPSISIYGSYKPSESSYIDGWVGYGFTSLKNKRWQSTDSVLVAGDRRANSFFGSLSIAGNYDILEARIEPYVRSDFMHSKLNAYSETGNSTNLLSYNSMSFNSLSISGGALAYYDINTSIGTFTPRLKGEYSSTNNSGGTQDMYYTNVASTVYSLGLDGIPTRVGSGQFALLYKNRSGVSGELGFEFSKGNSSYISRAFNAQLNVPF